MEMDMLNVRSSLTRTPKTIFLKNIFSRIRVSNNRLLVSSLVSLFVC